MRNILGTVNAAGFAYTRSAIRMASASKCRKANILCAVKLFANLGGLHL
jgi:hypothetical protein